MTERQIIIGDQIIKAIVDRQGIIDRDELELLFDELNASVEERYFTIEALIDKHFVKWMGNEKYRLAVTSMGASTSDKGIVDHLAKKSNQLNKVSIVQNKNIKRPSITSVVNQLSRDLLLENKTIKTTSSPPKPNDTRQSPNIWTFSNILFVVLTGIIVTIVGGLFLIYWPEIKTGLGW